MASITRSGTRRRAPVTMRLTKSELRLLLRGLQFLASYQPAPLPVEMVQMIADMATFFGNEAAGSPSEVTK